MKIAFSHAATATALFFTVPVMAASAIAAEPDGKAQNDEAQQQADDPEEAKPSAIVIPEIKEEKRTCRRVKLDMSSRRATKVCKTKDEWRDFNQRR